MIIDIINDYRKDHGKQPIHNWNKVENDFCEAHCLAMANAKQIFHAPGHFLGDRSEAVAVCSFGSDFNSTAYYLIFSVLNGSEPHRNILLNSNSLAYGVLVNDNAMYLTIRGLPYVI